MISLNNINFQQALLEHYREVRRPIPFMVSFFAKDLMTSPVRELRNSAIKMNWIYYEREQNEIIGLA